MELVCWPIDHLAQTIDDKAGDCTTWSARVSAPTWSSGRLVHTADGEGQGDGQGEQLVASLLTWEGRQWVIDHAVGMKGVLVPADRLSPVADRAAQMVLMSAPYAVSPAMPQPQLAHSYRHLTTREQSPAEAALMAPQTPPRMPGMPCRLWTPQVSWRYPPSVRKGWSLVYPSTLHRAPV